MQGIVPLELSNNKISLDDDTTMGEYCHITVCNTIAVPSLSNHCSVVCERQIFQVSSLSLSGDKNTLENKLKNQIAVLQNFEKLGRTLKLIIFHVFLKYLLFLFCFVINFMIVSTFVFYQFYKISKGQKYFCIKQDVAVKIFLNLTQLGTA